MPEATSPTTHAPFRQARTLQSVSWPGQLAAVAHSTQMCEPLQAPLAQSALTRQALPTPQRPHEPPQSVSVSLPLRALSVHEAPTSIPASWAAVSPAASLAVIAPSPALVSPGCVSGRASMRSSIF